MIQNVKIKMSKKKEEPNKIANVKRYKIHIKRVIVALILCLVWHLDTSSNNYGFTRTNYSILIQFICSYTPQSCGQQWNLLVVLTYSFEGNKFWTLFNIFVRPKQIAPNFINHQLKLFRNILQSEHLMHT